MKGLQYIAIGSIVGILLATLFYFVTEYGFMGFLFYLLVLGIVAYVLWDMGYFKSVTVKKTNDKVEVDIKVDVSSSAPPISPKEEVFNIEDNKFTYDQAEAVCYAYGARLASYKEIEEAYTSGASWTNYGWSKDGMALFPIQYDIWNKQYKKNNVMKVRPGINGGYFSKNMKFGVNCYGVKPAMTTKEILDMKSKAHKPDNKKFNDMVTKIKNEIDNIRINPFQESTWSEYTMPPDGSGQKLLGDSKKEVSKAKGYLSGIGSDISKKTKGWASDLGSI
jgi:hypothetical protein